MKGNLKGKFASFKQGAIAAGATAARYGAGAMHRMSGFAQGVFSRPGAQPAMTTRVMGANYQNYASGFKHGQLVNKFFTRTIPQGLRLGWNYVKSFVYHVGKATGGFFVRVYRALATQARAATAALREKGAAAKARMAAAHKANKAKRQEDWKQFKTSAGRAWGQAKKFAAKAALDPLGTATEVRLKRKAAATGRKQHRIPIVSDAVTVAYGATAGAAATYTLRAFGIFGSGEDKEENQ